MSDELTTAPPLTDGFDIDDESGPRRVIQGTRLRFTNNSTWIDADEEEIPSSLELVVVDHARVLQKWINQMPAETRFLEPGEKWPDLKKLNDAAPKSEWREVAGYILAHKLKMITNRDIQRGDRTMRGLDKRETDRVFHQLDSLGWLNQIPGARYTDPPRWTVNPEVHSLFAERGVKEVKRRRQAREAVTEITDHIRAAGKGQK